MKIKTLEDLYVDELKDLYNAEQQVMRSLPKMAKAAESEELRSAFEQHLEETKTQVRRLEEIFNELGMSPKGKKCLGMEGLIAEGQEIMSEASDPTVKDAGIISAAQHVEHYEIAGYGCARTFARTLGHNHHVELLQETLQEESKTDELLTQIAERGINQGAADGD